MFGGNQSALAEFNRLSTAGAHMVSQTKAKMIDVGKRMISSPIDTESPPKILDRLQYSDYQLESPPNEEYARKVEARLRSEGVVPFRKTGSNNRCKNRGFIFSSRNQAWHNS